MDEFTIDYAGAELTIRPIMQKDDSLVYQVYMGAVYLAEIYPDHGTGEDPPLVWRSNEVIHQDMVNAIGWAIEDHDA